MVTVIEECPGRSLIARGWAPWATAKATAVWRKLVRRYTEKFRLMSDPNRKSSRAAVARFGDAAAVR